MSSYSSSNSSSTASLMPRQQSRDYSATFATLTSSYGSSGAAPCRASSKTASHLATPTQSSSKRLRSLFSRRSKSSPSSQPEKYMVPKSQDFGALMDKYGATIPMGFGRSAF
ncbi:hypothetical protein FRC06_007606 [Ceratobasidium sp. 370]|nr:hypothetical protein FRC06_007606 [Ceratobasidium sp. 370]